MLSVAAVVAACLLVCLGSVSGDDSTFYIGTGRYDITGPAVQIEMVRHIASYSLLAYLCF